MKPIPQLIKAWLLTQRCRGQGIVEYGGALAIAGLIVSALILGTQQNNWMYNAYSAIITAGGNYIVQQANTIGGG